MKSKTTAALLALFLGGLGIHRFYLDESSKGILYLVFCWTFIPSMIAVIVFHFTNAPVLRMVSGLDPYLPEFVAARRANHRDG